MGTIDCFTKHRATYSWKYESEDLATFLQVAMLNGWGGYVLTQAGYVNAFFSQDEYIDFFAETDGCLEEVRQFQGAAARFRVEDRRSE